MEIHEMRFLDAYRASLHGESVKWEENITHTEWVELFGLADIHSLFPMVFESVYEKIKNSEESPAFVQGSFDKAVRKTTMQAKRTAMFLELYQFLAERNLRPMVMKGIICRNLYPNPEQRFSVDEDLLIPEELFGEYHKAFLEYGLYAESSEEELKKEHEISYRNNRGIYIELHKKPFPPESEVYGDLNRFFTETESRKITENIYGIDVCTLEYTDHLFYQLCHLYKHFLYSGMGIRQIGDITLFSIVYNEKIKWELIAERCREIGAFDFVKAVFKIGADYLFPGEFPKIAAQLFTADDIDEEALLKDILTGGLYGASSEDRLHSSNITINRMKAYKTGRISSTVLDTLFPPYEYMKKQYGYLDRFPVLLPAAWIQRIFTYGKNNIFKSKKGNDASEVLRIGKERVRLLEQYNIIDTNRKDVGK